MLMLSSRLHVSRVTSSQLSMSRESRRHNSSPVTISQATSLTRRPSKHGRLPSVVHPQPRLDCNSPPWRTILHRSQQASWSTAKKTCRQRIWITSSDAATRLLEEEALTVEQPAPSSYRLSICVFSLHLRIN